MRGQITNEKGVKERVKRLLDKHDWFWWMPPANGFGRAGISDFNALKDGVFLAIETKFGKNKPTPQQVGFLNSIRAMSGFGFVVNEETLPHLEKWLEAFGKSVGATARGEKPTTEDGATMLDCIRVLSP